jgi:lambda family phage minor tail protein L
MSSQSANINKQLVSLVPDSLIDLYEIDFSNLQSNFEELKNLYDINLGVDTVYRFCPMKNGVNPIIWQGFSYQPLPIRTDGFESQSDGKLPRPTLTLANPEGLFSKILKSNQDFANCKVVRKRTYARFLDEVNFQGGVNPFGSSSESSYLPDDVFYINNKKIENKKVIELELVSALELEDSFIPARVVLSGYCNFTYRCSIGCGYKGLPIETSEGKSLIKGFAVNKEKIGDQYDTGIVDASIYGGNISNVDYWNKYGKDGNYQSLSGYQLGDVVKIVPTNANNPYKSTPHIFVCIQKHEDASRYHPFFSKEYWLKDSCSKTIESCKKRFTLKKDPITGQDLTPYNESLKARGLRFGGFPGTERYPIE